VTRRLVLCLVLPLLGCNRAPSTAGKQASASALVAPSSAPAPPPEPPLSPPDASVIQLLSGLKPGDALGTAEVVEVFGVSDGRIPIHIARGTGHAWIEVSLRSEEPLPPVSTDHYSVYWTMRGVIADRLTDETVLDACLRLAERLKAVEGQTPPPKDLRQFPKPQPVAL
jgi:hypothetical protein